MVRKAPAASSRRNAASSSFSSSSSSATQPPVEASSSSSSTAPGGSTQPTGPVADEGTNKAECIICFEVVVKGAKIDGCIHKFCFECILNWSKVTNKCPICNTVFRKITEVLPEDPVTATNEPAAGTKRGRKRAAAGASKPAAKKPRTVRVQDKEQYVSYSHTGTFGDDEDDDYDSDDYSDSEEESEDHLYGHPYEFFFGNSNHYDDDSYGSEEDDDSEESDMRLDTWGLHYQQVRDAETMVLQSMLASHNMLNPVVIHGLSIGATGGSSNQVIDLTADSGDEEGDSSYTGRSISDDDDDDDDDVDMSDDGESSLRSSDISDSDGTGSISLEEDDTEDEELYQTMVQSGILRVPTSTGSRRGATRGTARGRSAPRQQPNARAATVSSRRQPARASGRSTRGRGAGAQGRGRGRAR